MSDRPLRYCDICGGLDDHPRHVIAVPEGVVTRPSEEFLAGLERGPFEAVYGLMNERALIRHIDCCAAAGCELCAVTESITAGARGEELLAVIQGGALAEVETEGLAVGGIENG